MKLGMLLIYQVKQEIVQQNYMSIFWARIFDQ
jgi:hypothetical protein